MKNKDEMLRVGVVTSTHGIKGEVKIFPTTDDMKRYENLKTVFFDTKTGLKEFHITQIKYFKNMVIAGFEELKTMNDAEQYKGTDILIERKDAVPLSEGEYFITDLMV